jgi:hypothetical protein
VVILVDNELGVTPGSVEGALADYAMEEAHVDDAVADALLDDEVGVVLVEDAVEVTLVLGAVVCVRLTLLVLVETLLLVEGN